MSRHTRSMLGPITAIVFTTLAAAASAMAGDHPGEMLLARRAAELDACRKIAQRVGGLHLSSQTTVRDFATVSDEMAADLDHLIHGVHFTEVRYFDDGTCEVDAVLDLALATATLAGAAGRGADADCFAAVCAELRSAGGDETTITETGCGAVGREERPADPAARPSIAEFDHDPAGGLPEPAQRYAPARRLLARRAAELDACRKLLEAVNGVRITSTSTVRELAGTHDAICATVEGLLVGARTASVRWGDDGVVEVQMELDVEHVVRELRPVLGGIEPIHAPPASGPRPATRRILIATGTGWVGPSSEKDPKRSARSETHGSLHQAGRPRHDR